MLSVLGGPEECELISGWTYYGRSCTDEYNLQMVSLRVILEFRIYAMSHDVCMKGGEVLSSLTDSVAHPHTSTPGPILSPDT